MLVNLKDGACRECGRVLRIVAASSDALSVECEACGEFYDAEIDAFRDGGMIYWPAFFAQQLRERDEECIPDPKAS